MVRAGRRRRPPPPAASAAVWSSVRCMQQAQPADFSPQLLAHRYFALHNTPPFRASHEHGQRCVLRRVSAAFRRAPAWGPSGGPVGVDSRRTNNSSRASPAGIGGEARGDGALLADGDLGVVEDFPPHSYPARAALGVGRRPDRDNRRAARCYRTCARRLRTFQPSLMVALVEKRAASAGVQGSSSQRRTPAVRAGSYVVAVRHRAQERQAQAAPVVE